MEFLYFTAPPGELTGYAADAVCHFCGGRGPGFDLEFAHCPTLCDDENRPTRDERKGKHGCYGCLRASRFQFHHDTEAGFLDQTSLRRRDRTSEGLPSAEALAELRRTPPYLTWQSESWRVHCGDFMVYLGLWSPADFIKNAADGDGRALFLAMTDEDEAFLWDEAIDEDEKVRDDWNVAYYAFRCRHCGRLRGHWDCD